ncbi:hypothetical protein C0995_006616 [Termitomyces sp. Mi166|nr:hypothetical protein C0995_006616 [Termitomyces sp. Mi166\
MSIFFQPRRPFRRLRSFHSLPSESYTFPTPEADQEYFAPLSVPANRTLPLRGAIIIRLALVVSLVFISALCFCFIGADVDEYFEKALTKTANTEPGIVLLGEDVDVDVDEPSVTIRWSILACGQGLFLPGSAGAHGSAMCGLPTQPLLLFVDNVSEPAAKYDPTQIPLNRDTGSRQSIQNLVQFDSDHVLDVHKAHLYPFDSYILTSIIRAVSETNDTIPIRRLLTIETTSSFNIDTADTETYSTSVSDTGTVAHASRDIDMHIARPASARIITIMLFTLNWIMAHAAGGLAYMYGKLTKTRPIVHLSAGAILIAIPQLRNSMPDAPGFDDTIGYFPQMIIAAGSMILIVLMVIAQTLDQLRDSSSLPPIYPDHARPPSLPMKGSSTTEIEQYERDRIMRHMNGEYIFPPVRVEIGAHDPVSAPFSDTSHRRSRPITSPIRMDG